MAGERLGILPASDRRLVHPLCLLQGLLQLLPEALDLGMGLSHLTLVCRDDPGLQLLHLRVGGFSGLPTGAGSIDGWQRWRFRLLAVQDLLQALQLCQESPRFGHRRHSYQFSGSWAGCRSLEA